MTEAEKKMRKYEKAIRRRLNLPKAVKDRVMADFSSSIQARRESGMTVEQICAEFGSPQKAAADLNEQMKEYTYRKSPWRYLFAAGAVYGAAELLSGLIAWLLLFFYTYEQTNGASIGIIGGADGPTAIFVTSPVGGSTFLMFLLVLVGIWGFLRFSRCMPK